MNCFRTTKYNFNYGNELRSFFKDGVVNPRNEAGKMGVRTHNCFTRLFYQTITVRTSNEKNEMEDFYLNKKSAIKWINAQSVEKEKLEINCSESAIFTRMRDIFTRTIDWQQPIYQNMHKGRASTHALCWVIDKIRGFFWDMFWNISTATWHLFRFRFAVVTSETLMQDGSAARANSIFWESIARVPAYKDFIAKEKTPPKTFAEIPVTDKPSYIKPEIDKQSIDRTMIDGVLPFKAQCDTSTGTTGKPTMWIRGSKERKMVRTLIHYATRAVLGNEPIFFINAFALGPWATGMTTSHAMFERAITFSTGADIEKILDALVQFPPEKYPGRKYVIAGYPPFMKDFVEAARKRNFDLNKYQIQGVVGGEPMADGIRSNVLGEDGRGNKTLQGFAQIMSSYGASDLDINIGYESPFEQELRKACKNNPQFAAELYGSNEPVPSIFHYDPLNYYIESNEEQELIFTCVRKDRISPRVRYNLHDRGKVERVQDVLAIAKKHGVQISAPRTNLPLVFVWGREGTTNFRGAKVPIAHLQEAVQWGKDLHNVTENLAFKETETKDGIKVSIMIELKKGVRKLSDQKYTELQKSLIKKLMELNSDFRFQAEKVLKDEDLPQLEVFEYGKSPMSNQDPHRKKQYIFRVTQ